MQSKTNIMKDFLSKEWDKCIPMVFQDNGNIVFMIYDIKLLRMIKLNSLSKNPEKITFNITKDSQILFELDFENEYLLVDYDIIWEKLETYIPNDNVEYFIEDIISYKTFKYRNAEFITLKAIASNNLQTANNIFNLETELITLSSFLDL